jgi:hypothetical protein
MTDCAAIGDSIAVGVAQVTKCRDLAAIGRTAFQQAAIVKELKTGLAVISLGSNMPTDPNLYVDMRYIRTKVKADRVVWIVPYHRQAAEAVRRVAWLYGDGVVELSDFKSNDRVHPANYPALAKKVMGK